jgi:L-2-hydroxyglutarate oxidase LhgO
MKSLETEAVTCGVTFAYGNELTAMRRIVGGDKDGAYELDTKTADDEAFSFTSRIVINAAGLYSDRVAAMAADAGNNADAAMAGKAPDGGMAGTTGIARQTGPTGPTRPGYKLHFLKGEYFRIGNGKNRLVNGLIYPVPDKYVTSLGVHVTIDLDGGAKLGPNAIYLEDGVLDYSVDAGHRDAFYESARKFLPFIEPDDLHPDQAGVRPKLQKPGEPFHDFVIKDETDAGLPGLINLVGIESPGLTACLAIAEYVEELLNIADR